MEVKACRRSTRKVDVDAGGWRVIWCHGNHVSVHGGSLKRCLTKETCSEEAGQRKIEPRHFGEGHGRKKGEVGNEDSLHHTLEVGGVWLHDEVSRLHVDDRGHGTTSARGRLLEANGGNAEEHRQDRCGARTCEGIPRTSSRDWDEETGRMNEDAPAVSHAEARHQQRVRTVVPLFFIKSKKRASGGLSDALGLWLKLMAGKTPHAFMVAERFVRRRSFSVSCQLFGAGPSAFGCCVEGHPRAVKHSSSKLLWDSNDGRPQKLSPGTYRRNCNKWPQDIKQLLEIYNSFTMN